ncbi:trehalase-domain-containing protein [Phakopsora pachyrhizi]|nr:trehalase-domain-containing protein [Phakopsora pachyrhizi]
MRLASLSAVALATSKTVVTSSCNIATNQQLDQLLGNIKLQWPSLLRSELSILDLVDDPKMPIKAGERFKLYVRTLPGSSETPEVIRNRLQSVNPVGDLDRVEVLELPSDGKIHDPTKHGAVYLPYPYVVPGGRFQEMYAWDSFFIAIGLLRDSQIRLARNMIDNYIYQIEHYGTILNGNRSYYLTRSQLPFLTPLIKLILPHIPTDHKQQWLQRAIRATEKYHTYWTTGSHYVPQTGLSRFFDYGPPGSSPPEIIHETDPRDGSTVYQRVKRFFRENYHQGVPDYDISEYYDYDKDELKAKFMDNDRAMRESGFDTSRRFGPFNSKILDFNPVCLNSLIALMEYDLSELYLLLPGSNNQIKRNQKLSRAWHLKGKDRHELIDKYNWDENLGLYFDYDYVKKERRIYKFATTFLPLWAGIASKDQALKVSREAINSLEIPGGISSSDQIQGDQWDKPYVWAPLQLFAVDGLRKYGFDEIADRLATKFGSMVLKTFIKTGDLWEKYEGIKRDETVDLKFGYPTNEKGFGWTNGR